VPERKNPIDATGKRVAETVAAVRDSSRMSYRELSDALDELGRGIPTLGLSRIERLERRVDADDLVALALALKVSPNRLLLPASASSDRTIELTNKFSASERDAWSWAQGQVVPGRRRYGGFRASNVPLDPRWDFSAIAEHFSQVHAVTNLVTDLAEEAGISPLELLALVQSVISAKLNEGRDLSEGGGNDND
jgi:transcriptional regulator with XRE-family HTH domain